MHNMGTTEPTTGTDTTRIKATAARRRTTNLLMSSAAEHVLGMPRSF
jgi:hypothetical protein